MLTNNCHLQGLISFHPPSLSSLTIIFLFLSLYNSSCYIFISVTHTNSMYPNIKRQCVNRKQNEFSSLFYQFLFPSTPYSFSLTPPFTNSPLQGHWFLSQPRSQSSLPLTYLLTYSMSRVLLEKLTGSAASQEIPRIFGTRRFLTIPTSARHLSLS